MKLPDIVRRAKPPAAAHRFKPVALGVVVGITLALSLYAVTPKVYQATTTLFLGSPASTDSSSAYSGDMFSQQRAASYAQLLASRDLAVKVIDDLGLNTTPDALSARVSGTPVARTVLMQISADDRNPQQAADIANAYAANFITYIGRLETPIGSNQPNSAVTVVERAEPPQTTTSSGAAAYVLAGAVIGGVLALLAVWLRRKLDRTVRTPEQVEGITGTLVLGVLPESSAASEKPLSPAAGSPAQSPDPYWEAVYKLRTNLTLGDGGGLAKAVALVAPRSAASTAVVGTHLAMALSSIGRKVALVDADLRESRLTRYLDCDSETGLAAAIGGTAAVDDVVVSATEQPLDVIPSGRSTLAPSDILASDGMAKVLAELCAGHDIVLCDTPGLLDATDASVVGQSCDAVLLVVVYGKTRIDELQTVMKTLRRLGVEPLGTILCESG